ncbi:MAG: histidinol-phosphatase [Eubacteriaceae bacterium]|nr:histidinol-phosphatase [Eubacteriaceae bacterium]MDD4507709.1 histidinol-phosphatase [Eubacteriaceae bacterium]
MIQTNYHIHSTYCDGQNSLSQMAAAAYQSGLNSIGFTSHAPLKYDNDWTMNSERLSDYFLEIAELKKKYFKKMHIFTGLEIDFYLDNFSITPLAQSLLSKVDYWIGSIHCMGCLDNLKDASIDYTMSTMLKGINQCFDGNSKRLVETYYKGIAHLANNYSPDIIGHFDIIKKNNVKNIFFNESESWYKNAWQNALDAIEASHSIIEINTGGIARYGNRCLYPSFSILKEIIRRKIPITITADSHQIKNINYGYSNLIPSLLAEAGVKQIMVFNGKKWVPHQI